MKKVLVLGASNSKKSINKKLAVYAASQLSDAEIIHIDMNDYEMPIYGIDREYESGIPEQAYRFRKLIGESDGVLISFAEHNGSYTTVFKNLMDWTSRIEGTLWQGKPLFFMATSPGGRGGKSVLEAAVFRAGFMDGKVKAQFSLPSFKNNFDNESGILDEELNATFREQLTIFENALMVG